MFTSFLENRKTKLLKLGEAKLKIFAMNNLRQNYNKLFQVNTFLLLHDLSYITKRLPRDSYIIHTEIMFSYFSTVSIWYNFTQ